jgi:hypothetical protein
MAGDLGELSSASRRQSKRIKCEIFQMWQPFLKILVGETVWKVGRGDNQTMSLLTHCKGMLQSETSTGRYPLRLYRPRSRKKIAMTAYSSFFDGEIIPVWNGVSYPYFTCSANEQSVPWDETRECETSNAARSLIPAEDIERNTCVIKWLGTDCCEPSS